MDGGRRLVVGLGEWGAQVVGRLDELHPEAARRGRLVRVEGANTDSGAVSTRERLVLVRPDARTFRARAGSIAAQLPRDWSRDGPVRVPDDDRVDERCAWRLALAAGESRLRTALGPGRPGSRDGHALVVAAPDEPLVSAALHRVTELAHQGREGVHGLLGLHPLAARQPAEKLRAARLAATLAALEARAASKEAQLGAILVVGRADLAPDAARRAAREVLAAWLCLSADELGALVPSDPTPWRGRRPRVTLALGATAEVDVERRVEEDAARLAREARERIVAKRDEPEALRTATVVSRWKTALARIAWLPEPDDLDPDAMTLTSSRVPRRLETALAALQQEAEAERDRVRQALFGGAIQRLTQRVERGWLDEQLDWAWQLLARGQVTFDHFIGWLNGLGLALPLSQWRSTKQMLEHRLEVLVNEAKRRRIEKSRPEEIAQVVSRAVTAATLLSRLDVTLQVTEELNARLVEASRGLLAAKAGLDSLAAAAREPGARRAVGPWHVRLPIGAAAVAPAPLEPFLARVARDAPGDAARGLGKDGALLLRALRDHVREHVASSLKDRPLASAPGLAAWLARFVDSLPPTASIDEHATPPASPPRHRCLLLADAAPAALESACQPAPRLVPLEAPTRIAWLALTGPTTWDAVADLAPACAALHAARRAGRMAPLPEEFPSPDAEAPLEPRVGDLVERLQRIADLPPRSELDELDVASALERVAAAAAAAPPSAATTTVRLLNAWLRLENVEDLAATERSVLDAAEQAAADGSDAELHAVFAKLGGVAEPLKKGLETGDPAERVRHFVAGRTALETAGQEADACLGGFDRRAVAAVVERWRAVIAARVAALRGRARLSVVAKTRRLVSAGSTTLLLELRNEAPHPAESARVTLLPSSDFRVLGEPAVMLDKLPAHATRTLQFEVKPARSGTVAFEVGVEWNDLEQRGKKARQSIEVELLDEPPPFRRIESNPYIAGPPVRSESMFFGRDDVFRHVAENLAGRHQDNVLILFGQRRTGKSSILYQLERRDLLPEHVGVIVDLQGLGGFDTSGFLYSLARQIARSLRKRIGETAPGRPSKDDYAGDPWEAFQDFLDDAEDALEPMGRRLLIMIDEFDVLQERVARGLVEPEIFPFLRNLMQHRERVAFLLAGTHRIIEMQQDYWSALFSLASPRKVSYLGDDDARELVQRPLAGEVVFDDLVLDHVLHLTAGHPYYLQLTCQCLVQHLNENATQAFVRPEDVSAVLPRVLEAGGGHFEHEWSTLPALARCALALMADSDDTGLHWFEPADVAGRLDALGRSVKPEALLPVFDDLVARDAIEPSTDRASFRLRIDLMRRWIRSERPVARTLSEAGAA